MFNMFTAESLDCRLVVDGVETVAATTRLVDAGHIDVRPLLQALRVKPSTPLRQEPFRRAVRRSAARYSCPVEEIVECTLADGGPWQPVAGPGGLSGTTRIYVHPDLFPMTEYYLRNPSLSAFLASQRQVAQRQTPPPAPVANSVNDAKDHPAAAGPARDPTHAWEETGQTLKEWLHRTTAALESMSSRLDRLEDLVQEGFVGLTDLIAQRHASLVDLMWTVQDRARASLRDEFTKQDAVNNAVAAFCWEIRATMQGVAPFQARVLQILEELQRRPPPVVNVNIQNDNDCQIGSGATFDREEPMDETDEIRPWEQ